MYGRHDVKMQPHTMSCKHHETSASWKVRYFVLPCSTCAVLAEKPCSHLQACQHAITCRPDQSSHVRRYTSAGCTAWHRANTQARLVCNCSASHEETAFRAVSHCLAVSVSCRISNRVCSSVMQDAVQLGQVLLGRSGLHLAANERRH